MILAELNKLLPFTILYNNIRSIWRKIRIEFPFGDTPNQGHRTHWSVTRFGSQTLQRIQLVQTNLHPSIEGIMAKDEIWLA